MSRELDIELPVDFIGKYMRDIKPFEIKIVVDGEEVVIKRMWIEKIFPMRFGANEVVCRLVSE